MKTEDLIVRLAADARPVQPLATPLVRLARWVAVALPLTAVIAILGARADIRTIAAEPSFLCAAAVTLATALFAAGAALLLGVPGADRNRVSQWIPIATGIAWTALLAITLVSAGRPPGPKTALFHVACALEITALALLPGWWLLTMLRRAAPLRAAWSAGLATLAAVALGAAGTQIICPVDDPAHQLVGHVGPVVVLALAGTLFGRHHLEWRPRLPNSETSL